MAQEFKELWINYVVAALFVFVIFGFLVQLPLKNNVSNSITNNAIINSSYNNLNSSLSGLQSQANQTRYNFEHGSPLLGVGELVFNTLFTGVKTLTSVLVALFDILIALPTQFLGISPIVYGVVFAIFLISMTLLFWRLVKQG